MSERSKEHASKACEGETLREFESRLIRSTPWVSPAGFLVIKSKTARFQRFRGVSPYQAGLRRGAYRYMSWRILGDALGAWWARAATPVRMIGNDFGPYMRGEMYGRLEHCSGLRAHPVCRGMRS